MLIRALKLIGSRSRQPGHLLLGERGEVEAYFYLRSLGYRIVATNFRAPHNRGEIDVIGWDGDVLCFVEVKTRTDDSFAPPSTAVTRNKQRNIISVAARYLRRVPGARRPTSRFDILSIVIPSQNEASPQFTLRKGAFAWDADRPPQRRYRDFADSRFRRPGR